MKIIIGLGNPGDKYINTRHNAGFIMLDHLTKLKNLSWQQNKKFNAILARDNDIFYVKPLTYMNDSGQTAEKIMSYYKLLPKKLGILRQKNAELSNILTVIHDDLDISLGEYRKTNNSRSAGHRGVASIINYLKTQKFNRIKIGIKTNLREKIPAQKFVLQNFSKQELEIIKETIKKIHLD